MADVVFLDLPTPWDAIPHVKQVLKRDRLTRMACFSPCLEQIQRTFTALVKHGFSHLRLHECLLRNYEIKPVPIKTMDYVRRKHRKKVTEPFQSSLLGRPCQEAKGHTSFVLFAQLLPENHLITSGEITRENEVNEPQGEVLCFESSST
ncbi:hypothetical protein HMI56_005284 [Coelomomyces lativittatus]|nr:hypothetical protein HMI56_005284 [Coelomomyces lativittatus]